MSAGAGTYQSDFLLENGVLRVFPKPFQLDDVCRAMLQLAAESDPMEFPPGHNREQDLRILRTEDKL